MWQAKVGGLEARHMAAASPLFSNDPLDTALVEASTCAAQRKGPWPLQPTPLIVPVTSILHRMQFLGQNLSELTQAHSRLPVPGDLVQAWALGSRMGGSG